MHFRSADAANHLNARPRVPREIKMTRRAYLAQLLRVIRWQGAANLKIKIKRQLGDSWPKFYSVWKVRKFVLQFDNFPGQEKWNDEHMQRESSGGRRNDEFIDSQKLIFWWILLRPVTLLMKFRFFVKFPALGDLEPSPGRKWRRGIEIHAETSPKPSKLEKMTK